MASLTHSQELDRPIVLMHIYLYHIRSVRLELCSSDRLLVQSESVSSTATATMISRAIMGVIVNR